MAGDKKYMCIESALDIPGEAQAQEFVVLRHDSARRRGKFVTPPAAQHHVRGFLLYRHWNDQLPLLEVLTLSVVQVKY